MAGTKLQKGVFMTTDPLTFAKLIVLYMLDKVDFTLTNSQISEFVIDKGYTNYFTLQQAFSELESADFISSHTVRNSSHYAITDEGRHSLEYFGKSISDDIKSEIDEFLKANRYHLRSENEILADYYQEKPDQYIVRCQIKEKGQSLVNLILSVTSEQQAITICDNWRKKNSEFYNTLVHTLFLK